MNPHVEATLERLTGISSAYGAEWERLFGDDAGRNALSIAMMSSDDGDNYCDPYNLLDRLRIEVLNAASNYYQALKVAGLG